MQRERLGEWAAVLCIGLFVFLSFTWPDDHGRRKSPPPPLPEPTAAYVEVSFSKGRPDVLPRYRAKEIDGAEGTFALLPREILPPPSPIPTNVFETTKTPDLPPLPSPSLSYRRFPIEYPAPEFPSYGPNAKTNTLFCLLSTGLQEAGFSFIPPENGIPVNFTCIIDLAPDGRVRTLLMDGKMTPKEDLIPWRRALLAGHGQTNGHGRVEIETRLPPR